MYHMHTQCLSPLWANNYEQLIDQYIPVDITVICFPQFPTWADQTIQCTNHENMEIKPNKKSFKILFVEQYMAQLHMDTSKTNEINSSKLNLVDIEGFIFTCKITRSWTPCKTSVCLVCFLQTRLNTTTTTELLVCYLYTSAAYMYIFCRFCTASVKWIWSSEETVRIQRNVT